MTSRNPDPKPGRWILPLVIVGMVGFTYFFVQQLPAAAPDETTTTSQATSTTTSEPGEGGEVTTTTTPPEIPADVQAYVDRMLEAQTELAAIEADLLSVNSQQDATPRVIEYTDALAQFRDVEDRAAVFADGVELVVPPAGNQALADAHAALTTAAGKIRTAAADAMAGFEGPTAEPRRSAVAAFQEAAVEFNTALDNMVAVATGSTAPSA